MIVFFIPIYEYSYQVFLYDFKKTTNYYGDIEYYVSMANGAYSDVIAPYKFRVLIPFLWSLFLPVLTFNQSYLIWNFLFLLGSSLLTDRYLNSLDFSNTMRIIGVVLLNISIPIIPVGFVPTVDLGVLFFAILFMIGVVKNKWWLIGISSVLGVITKESIFFLFPLYFIYNHERIIDSVKKLFNEKVIPKNLLLTISFMVISFIIFLGIRCFIFNVNYDFNFGAGEFPNYYIYWFDGTANLRILWIFFTFTILWIGIFSLIIISLLFHKITRVGYFLVFIYLPIFLRFLNDFKGSERYKNNKFIGNSR